MVDLARALKARALLLGMLLPAKLAGEDPPRGAPSEAPLNRRPEPAGPRPGERIASWVTSRELLYASTDAHGTARQYSGRVYLPTPWLRRPLPVPLVVYVHATEAEPDNIPQFNRGGEAMAGAMAATLYPFVVAMPDLPGYGHDPSPRPHPYCHAKSLAHAILDMVRPALEVLDPRQLQWDGRLFLMGYSSGGYGALAAVKERQTNPQYADLPLTAAACMGGPFHLSEATRACLTSSDPYTRPDIQAFLLRAYHDLYPDPGVFAPHRALNPFLLETRAAGLDQGALPSWLEGACSGDLICRKIRARLTGAPHTPVPAGSVLNPHWLETQFNAPAWPDTEVGRILAENDLVGGWHPTVPILLAASPGDDCVPARNTYALMDDWARRGCTAKVAFYPLTLFGQPLDHLSAATLALEKAFRWFASGAYAQEPRSRL